MFQRMGIILDLPFKNNVISISIDNYQNILEICSTLIALYNSENPSSQIIILISRNFLIGQITHLTGDTRHLYQGIWYLIFGNKKIHGTDLGFFFTERINVVKREKTKYEIFFISEGSLDFLDSNFFAVFMGKEGRCFSVISLGMKFFAIQILTKITGGKYINLILKQKTTLSQILLKNFQHSGFFTSTYYLNSSFVSNRIIFERWKKLTKITKIKFCPKCKNSIFSITQHWCENCGVFLLSGQYIFNNNIFILKEFRTTRNHLFIFNLFIPILNKERKKLRQNTNKIFNFFNFKKKSEANDTPKKTNRNKTLLDHQEILVTMV